MSGHTASASAQQPRSTATLPAPESSAAPPCVASKGAVHLPLAIKPFKISKEATPEQRNVERMTDPSAADRRQAEFERKWCSHNPFKPIWRPPEPKVLPTAAKRKRQVCAEEEAGADAVQPRHLELDKWLRHTLAARRRQAELKDAAKAERQRRREEVKTEDAMDEGDSDGAEEEEEEPARTLQGRLLEAQIGCGMVTNRRGEHEGVAGPRMRKNEGWGGADGVRCTLHAADRMKDLTPSIRINLFPGGYSIDGEPTGRVYDMRTKEFLAGLDRGKIPAKKLLELSGHSNFAFSDGCLLVEVRDFRIPRNLDQKPAVWTVVLEADSGTVAQDLSVVAETHKNLNADDLLLVEKRMLLVTQPSVCLDPHPHVAVIASSLHRRANRMSVWHTRSTRSAISQFRRTFDAGAIRRLHAAVHVSNTSGLDPATPVLSVSKSTGPEQSVGGGGERPNLSCSLGRGVWKGNRLLEGWDIDGDGKDGAMQMATALRQLKASALPEDYEVLTGPKSSHGMIGAKNEGRAATERATAEGGGAGGGERAVPRNYFLPRQYLRDGMPPERQMRFRKDNQVVTIAIENKGASLYQLRSWLHEFGPDGKAVESASIQMPPQIVGNSKQARLFGGQLFGVYHREGWQCTGDSHQPASRKAGASGNSGGSSQAAASGGGASRPAALPSAGNSHGRGSAAAGSANSAGRGASPAGRGTSSGGYPSNGPGAVRPTAPKPKQGGHVGAHQPVASPHMMAGRGAPGSAPAGQARATMPHPGSMTGQQMHMQQGYRPPVGAHQVPAQQQYPHQVPSAHAAHAAHQSQGVPPYHAAAGRAYMPQHHQVAGRGVAPGQPGVRPPVSNVAPPGSAASHQKVYKGHPGAAPQAYSVAPQQQQAQGLQAMASSMPLTAGSAPAMQQQHGSMQQQQQQQQQQRQSGPAAKPSAASTQVAAGRGHGPAV